MNSLQRLIKAQKNGQPVGMCSICSANPFVLETCMENAKKNNSRLLIEATSNQINQQGGYTGMKPLDFVKYAKSLSQKIGIKWEMITLGGDHLGPTPFQSLPARVAMQLSEEMVYEYVAAGFQKIHLDASMVLKDDQYHQGLDTILIAKRTAQLALAAEQAVMDHNIQQKPLYIIGTDVPIPGGFQEIDENILVSQPFEVQDTLEETKKAFYQVGLTDGWERVIGIVVRTGVEFGDQIVFRYQSAKTKELSRFIEKQPQIIYEAHSTDYQTADDLKQMVKDHFAILKVGPALTFAFREAVYSLASIEEELRKIGRIQQPSNIIKVLDQAMVEDPTFWIKYYKGDRNEVEFARKFSLSDRSRYYWTKPQVVEALQLLLDNLSQQELPWSLVSQFFPDQADAAKQGREYRMPRSLISNNINRIIKDYSFACGEGTVQ